jgi:hypothetical protein
VLGAVLEQVAERLLISVASTRISGRSSGSSTITLCAAMRSDRRARTAPTISLNDAQSRSGLIALISSRVICKILATCSDISRAWSKMLFANALRSGSVNRSPLSSRLDDAPAMTASGVRRSCDIEASRVLRIRSVSARFPAPPAAFCGGCFRPAAK